MVILFASFLMIACQLFLLYLWVVIRAECGESSLTSMSMKTSKEKKYHTSFILRVLESDRIRNFWFWDEFSSYTKFLVGFAFVMFFITLIFGENALYQSVIGFSSGAIEAMLGVPQFLLNYKRKNTSGLR